MKKTICKHRQKASSSVSFLRVLALNVVVFAGAHNVYAQVNDSVDSDSVSMGIYFHKSDSRLDYSYRDNGEALRHLYDAVTSHSGSSVKKVEILSAASPEGNTGFNCRLSDSRAQAVIKAVSGLPGFCADSVRVVSAGEDWNGLKSLLSPEKSSMTPPPPPPRGGHAENAAYERFLSEFPKLSIAERKAMLRSVKNPALRRYIYDTVLPELRAAQVKVTYTYPVSVAAPESGDSFSAATTVEVADTAEIADAATMANEADSVGPLIGGTDFESRSYVSTEPSRRDFFVAVGSNLLYDVLAVPNLSVEAGFGKGWGVRLDGMYAWWSNKPRGKYWRLQGGSLTVRKYFGRQPFSGHHVGVLGSILRYDFCFGRKGVLSGGSDVPFRVRPSWNAGVEYGYSFVLTRRLRFDLSAGFGYQWGRYVRYHNEDGMSFWDSAHRRHWIGPVRAEASLVWVIGKGGGL